MQYLSQNKIIFYIFEEIKIMKTLTLHINDSIYDKVKNFLVLIPSEKIKIEKNTETETLFSENYFNKKEFKKILDFFKKFNIPFPKDYQKFDLKYNENDLDIDIDNLKNLNLLK